MAKYSESATNDVKNALHERKEGTLKSGKGRASRSGPTTRRARCSTRRRARRRGSVT